MRDLTTTEIAKLAGRAGVRRIAVENFLGSLSTETPTQALGNLRADARDYGWNQATQSAIMAGIKRAS